MVKTRDMKPGEKIGKTFNTGRKAQGNPVQPTEAQ